MKVGIVGGPHKSIIDEIDWNNPPIIKVDEDFIKKQEILKEKFIEETINKCGIPQKYFNKRR